MATPNSTFKPVTFRSGTGTSTSNTDGMTTSLNEPYAGLSGLVGAGTGLLGQASQQAQQAPNQFSYNFDPNQRGQELFNQRSAMLEPAFAQQRAQGQESMFGTGRLGLRLAGEGVGAGSGMVQPDAFGMNQAQSQALAQTAAQSTTDAFGESMQRAGLDSNQFGMNQQAQQQQYANMMGSGQGMLQAGMQGTQLEQNMAQQQLQNQQLNQDYNLAQQNYNLAQLGQAQDYGLNQQNFNLASQGQMQNYGLAQQQQMQDYGFNQQNYGLAQQQQMQDYGLGQQKIGLAEQQQLQDYEMGMLSGNRQFGLQNATLAQNYELGKEQNAISRITGQAQANNLNYQPNWWETAGTGLIGGLAGTEAGAGYINDGLSSLYNTIFN